MYYKNSMTWQSRFDNIFGVDIKPKLNLIVVFGIEFVLLKLNSHWHIELAPLVGVEQTKLDIVICGFPELTAVTPAGIF